MREEQGFRRTLNSKTKERTPAANTSRAWKGNSAGARTRFAAAKTGFPTARTSLMGKRRMGGEKMRSTTDSDDVTMLVVSSRMPRTMAATSGKRITVKKAVKRASVAGSREKRPARAVSKNMVASGCRRRVVERGRQGGSRVVVDMVVGRLDTWVSALGWEGRIKDVLSRFEKVTAVTRYWIGEARLLG